MKRIVSLVLALSMVLSMFATAFAGSTLTDVEGTEYESAVSALVELGLVKGRGNNKYEPEEVVTRAEMAKLLVIASGLEDAAELNVGATNFSDVAANHWATGFINVASEYGFINGYPEGTFAPDAEVKYSEAVTMAIRALGYASVVESKGTWPTNYIQQARELKVLDGVKYASYGNGATRGNVALLVWNMLRTEMWDIGAENETNGLTYGKNGMTMIDKYFEDYSYATVLFESVKINDKLEVLVTLDDDNAELLDEVNTLEKKDETYKYLANDFYKFVPGTEVEVLVNEEDETLLTIVPTGSKELVEGTKVFIDDEYEAISGDTYSYVYATVDGNEIDASRQLVVVSDYIYDVDTKTSTKYVKLNGDADFTIKYEDAEETLFIVDGERGDIEDVKVGTVLSNVTIKGTAVSFYVVTTPAEANGKLTKVVEKDFEDSAVEGKYTVATVGGKDYSMVDTAVYFEDPEDFKVKDIEALKGNYDEDMNGENVTVKFDFLNRVVAFEFDGKIGDEDEDITVGFFTIASNVDIENRKYVIDLENENGKDTYSFDKSYAAGKELYADTENDYIGTFCAVTFDDEGEIELIQLFGNALSGDEVIDTTVVYEEGEGLEADKVFSVQTIENAKFDDEKMTVSGDEIKVSVDEDVVIITLLVDEDEDEPEFSYEIAEGTKAIAKLDGENVIVVKDASKNFSTAKYIVLYDTVSNKEDDLFVIVEDVLDNGIGGLIVEGKADEELEGKFYLSGDDTALTEEELENFVAILYSVEEKVKNEKVERKYTIIAGYEEYTFAADYANHAYIAEEEDDSNVSADGRKANITIAGSEYELDLNDYADDYEDTKVIILNVSRDEDDKYVPTSYEEVDFATVELEELDRISMIPFGGDYDFEGNNVPDTIVILRGYASAPVVE